MKIKHIEKILKRVDYLEKNGKIEEAGYLAWMSACSFYKKKEYDVAKKLFNKANILYNKIELKNDYYEFREHVFNYIRKNEIREALKKFSYFIERIISSGDFLDLDGETITISVIFLRIGRYDIARCFLLRCAEAIWEKISNDFKIYGKEKVAREMAFDETSYNADIYDFAFNNYIFAEEADRALYTYKEICKSLDEKGIEIFSRRLSFELSLAYLLKGSWQEVVKFSNIFLDELKKLPEDDIKGSFFYDLSIFIKNLAESMLNKNFNKRKFEDKLEKFVDKYKLRKELKNSYKENYKDADPGELYVVLFKRFLSNFEKFYSTDNK